MHSTAVEKLLSLADASSHISFCLPGVIYDAAYVSETLHLIQHFTFQHNGSICDRFDLLGLVLQSPIKPTRD